MFGLQPTHWLIIAVVALLFFAPQRLPELVKSLGKTVKEFRAGVREGDQTAPAAPSKPTDPPAK